MHFKNGREAKEGDPVIVSGYGGAVTVGKIHSLSANTTTCNCTVAEVVVGGVQQLTCQTVGLMYHAEDAFKAMEAATADQALKAAENADVASARTE